MTIMLISKLGKATKQKIIDQFPHELDVNIFNTILASKSPQHENVIYHDQIGIIPRMQRWLNVLGQ